MRGVVLLPRDRGGAQALEIGSTWYAAPFQGGRVNPATKLALMGHVFEALGWNRVEFKVDARNARSLAAMRKLGAIEEGTFRAHMVLPDGGCAIASISR